jgi:undecaprenyl-diphosphatase
MNDINTAIFFVINKLVGRSRFLDNFGRAGAEWLIIAMGAWYGGAVLVARMPETARVIWPLVFLLVGWSVMWLINLGVASLVRESRPFVTYPHIKTLFTPLMAWKSFPSDHAASAFIIVFFAYLFNLPGSWALIPMAIWVCWGRVFAGVHYPLDIVGGFTVALFVSMIARYLAMFLHLM